MAKKTITLELTQHEAKMLLRAIERGYPKRTDVLLNVYYELDDKVNKKKDKLTRLSCD